VLKLFELHIDVRPSVYSPMSVRMLCPLRLEINNPIAYMHIPFLPSSALSTWNETLVWFVYRYDWSPLQAVIKAVLLQRSGTSPTGCVKSNYPYQFI
jgi:hypothetical protein